MIFIWNNIFPVASMIGEVSAALSTLLTGLELMCDNGTIFCDAWKSGHQEGKVS
jgi:hypothetical protein